VKHKAKDKARRKALAVKRGLVPVYHQVQIKIVINSHEVVNTPQGIMPGPIKVQKDCTFSGEGHDLEEAISKAHADATAFLQSDAVSIGAVEKPRILEPFPGKKKDRGDDEDGGGTPTPRVS
jgi:hypothetical protein